MRIAIVGLGVGGSVATAALAERGLDVNVYEQAAAVKEVGAGVSIGPNAVRPLRELGFDALLKRVGCEIGDVRINDQSGGLIELMPAPAASDGIPGYQCHRADLLNGIVARIPPERIHLDHHCMAWEEVGNAIRLKFGNGQAAECDVLVAADGIRSPIQRSLPRAGELTFSGLAAYRGLIDASMLPGGSDCALPPAFNNSTFWTTGERYFLIYPVSAGRQLNFVGVVPTHGVPDPSWYGEAPLDDLRKEFAGWCPDVQQIISSTQRTFRWGMFYRRPLTWMVSGRTALLGDAAHPMVIHAGQGAGQAIEDAFSLAELLADATPASLGSRLAIYESLRLPRTAAVQRQSLSNAQFMTRGVIITENDRESPTTALGGRSWLYTYDIVRKTRDLLSSASSI